MKNKFVARKSLGQHFLRSDKAIGQIVEVVGAPTKTLFEIGPGEGVLTSRLLEAGHSVVVIEIDKRSIEVLENDFREYISSGQLKIINKDCLEVNYSDYLGVTKEFVLVGNIPYYITGAIFRHTFEQKILPKQAVFLVQKEVAQRVVAREKGKIGKESLLSISVKIFVKSERDIEIVDYVKAGSFSPPPKVDSAILNLNNIINPFTRARGAGKEKVFFEILKAAFSQKRKFLMSNLKSKLTAETFTKYNNIFAEIFIKKYGEKARAEDIKMEHWRQLLAEL
jgi:16S rRNA (adenine1518-N6/adenine1519-N6)-dimethyltransferase